MNLLSFDLNLLKVFDALLAERSTVRAGARVGLSQPAVSAALARLRASLGDPLLVRQGQGLVATEFAQRLALPLRAHLDAIAELLAPETFDPARSNAVFRIAGMDIFGELLAPRLAQRLAREAPGVRISMLDLVPEDYPGTLERYDADIALVPPIPLPGWVQARPIFHSSFALIARRDHPRLARAGLRPGTAVPVDLFCDLGHVLMSQEGRLTSVTDAALERVGRTRRVMMTLPYFNGIARTVADSDLVAMIPRQLAQHMAGLLPLDLYGAPREVPVPIPLISMIWHRRRDADPAARWFRALIGELLAPLNDGEPPLPA